VAWSVVTFEKKGKFPSVLKAPLLNLALTALFLSPDKSLDNNFFNYLSTILPYHPNDLRVSHILRNRKW
jgi:hypothetical protein